MDEVNILKKIQDIKLELAKKQKKLMKLNKRNESRRSLNKDISANASSEIVADPELCLSPQPLPDIQLKSYVSPVTVTNKAESNLCINDICKEDVRKHSTLYHPIAKRKTRGKSSACDTSDIEMYDLPGKVINNKITGHKVSNPEKSENFHNHEEELFPDDDTNVIDGDGLLDDSTLKEDSFQNGPKEDNCMIKRSNTNSTGNTKSNYVSTSSSASADCTGIMLSDDNSDDQNLKRRSSRLSSTSLRKRYSSSRTKLDSKSIINVAFDILCEMGRHSKEEEFSLPDKEFYYSKLKRFDERINSEILDVGNADTMAQDHAFSESMIPPTFVASPRKFRARIDHCKSSPHVFPVISNKILETNNFHNKSVLISAPRTLSVAEFSLISEKKELQSDDSVHESRTVATKDNRDDCENQELYKTSRVIRNGSENNCNNFVMMEAKLHNTQDTNSAYETIEAIEPIKADDTIMPCDNVRSTCQVSHFIQGSEGDCVRNVFLARSDGFLVAWLQKEKNVSVSKQEAEDWMHLDTYMAPKIEEILDSCVFDKGLAVLFKGWECSIRILTLADSRIHIQTHISLGVLSRTAISGSLGALQDQNISSFLQFENQCPQIEVHTVTPSQPTSTIYIEPASEKLLCPVFHIRGLPGGLVGLGKQKLFIWNISTGLLVRTVSLRCSGEPNHSFEKCIWAKIEKGLLFGVFTDDKSENWKLFVINPATGLYHELCQYVCPTCSTKEYNEWARNRHPNGRVECHKLLSICIRHHMTIFELLSAKALVASKTEDTQMVSLCAHDLAISSINGSVHIYKIICKK